MFDTVDHLLIQVPIEKTFFYKVYDESDREKINPITELNRTQEESKSLVRVIIIDALSRGFFYYLERDYVRCYKNFLDWMNSRPPLNEYASLSDLATAEDPLILVVPAAQLRFAPKSFYLLENNLFLVSRKDSFEVFMKTSRSNNLRNVQGHGQITRYLFSDNLTGMGKTTMGRDLVYMIQGELAEAKMSNRQTVVNREFLEEFKYANYLHLNCI